MTLAGGRVGGPWTQCTVPDFDAGRSSPLLAVVRAHRRPEHTREAADAVRVKFMKLSVL